MRVALLDFPLAYRHENTGDYDDNGMDGYFMSTIVTLHGFRL